MTEYEMLLHYNKTKDQNILYEFFKLYQGLITKLYYKGYSAKLHLSLEDFKQECYLLLQSLIEYIDVTKITEKEKWKIYGLYIGKIFYYKSNIYKKLKQDALFHSEETDFHEMEFISYPAENDLKITLDNFIETLPSEDKKIFKCRYMNEDYSVRPYKKVAKMCHRSDSYIHNKIKILTDQLYEYIKEEPSRRI